MKNCFVLFDTVEGKIYGLFLTSEDAVKGFESLFNDGTFSDYEEENDSIVVQEWKGTVLESTKVIRVETKVTLIKVGLDFI